MVRRTKLKDGSRIERNIFARVAADGRLTAFQVKVTVPGTKHVIAQRFDRIEEARSYRDSLGADMALDAYQERVLRAREDARRKRAIMSVLLSDVLLAYKLKVTPTRKGASSQAYMVERLRSYPIAKLPVIGITLDAVDGLATAIEATGVARTTIGKHLALLSAVLKWARVEYKEPRIPNPVLELAPERRSTASRERDRRLLAGEEGYLRGALAQSSNEELVPIFDLALETGARLSELLTLKRQDVDLAGLVALVRETKNGGDRQLLLSPHAVDVLRGLLGRNIRHIDGRVFRLTKSNLGQRWFEAKARAKRTYLADCKAHGNEPNVLAFEDLRWHDLRHEAISRVAELGWSEIQLMMFSGHREPRMLLRYVQYRQRSALATQLPDRRMRSV